jgi:hypothetical protein
LLRQSSTINVEGPEWPFPFPALIIAWYSVPSNLTHVLQTLPKEREPKRRNGNRDHTRYFDA